MRKYIVSLLVGALIVGGTVAAADTVSLVGKTVKSEAPVVVNGEVVGSAVVIDGTSYAPVRAVAEAVGVSVGYSKGEVLLTDDTKAAETALRRINARIEIVNGDIDTAESLIVKWGKAGDTLADDYGDYYAELVASAESDLVTYRETLAELEAEKLELVEQIAGAYK